MVVNENSPDLSSLTFKEELEFRYKKHGKSGGTKITWLEIHQIIFGHSSISSAGARNAFTEGKKPIILTPIGFVQLVRGLRQAFDRANPQLAYQEALAWYNKSDRPAPSLMESEQLQQELRALFFGTRVPKLRGEVVPYAPTKVTSVEIKKKIFISYKRNSTPDEQLALQLYAVFQPSYQVFIDQTMAVGTEWASRIEAELRQADFLITLLSADSINSEMVEWEIATASRLAQEQAGKPTILPVRLAYKEAFAYPLDTYLNHINWAYWNGPEGTLKLIEELKGALVGQKLNPTASPIKLSTSVGNSLPAPFPAAQPLQLETPEGTMDPQSIYYVARAADFGAIETIQKAGVTITIKGPRQMGKSTLLIRTINTAREVGKRVVYLDFQRLDKNTLENATNFFRHFCDWLSYSLKIENQTERYWRLPMGNILRCTEYIGDYLLNEVNHPLVLGIDEVDKLYEADFRVDFFGMLRSWHNDRMVNSIWKQLDLVLVTSTEPYQLINNLNQSPFNVGEVISLEDFTQEQVEDLNNRHHRPFNPTEIKQLRTLIGGHPYLIRRALYLVASHRISVTDLFETALEDRGPFGDHLRYHLFQLNNKPELVTGFRQVILNNTCPDDIFYRLRGAGLVTQQVVGILPRCQLYAEYFKQRLILKS